MQFDLTPAQRALQAKASALARGPIAARAAEIDRSEEYPWDNIALLKEAGRTDEANRLFGEVMQAYDILPRHARRQQREWAEYARKHCTA